MISIIGVNDAIQRNIHNGKKVAMAEFQQYLREEACSYEISVFAEVYSSDTVEFGAACRTTVEQMARELEFQYMFCDVGKAERSRLGIKIPGQRHIYWLERLKPFLDKEIFFICGNQDTGGFRALLSRTGHNAQILTMGWG